jgi:hypothetical protein
MSHLGASFEQARETGRESGEQDRASTPFIDAETFAIVWKHAYR